MKEFIEKLIERLEEYQKGYKSGLGELTDELVFRVMCNVISIVNELAEEYKDKDCSQCSRRKFYQQGYEDAKKEYINTSTDISTDTSTTNAEWKQHILNRFEGDSR